MKTQSRVIDQRPARSSAASSAYLYIAQCAVAGVPCAVGGVAQAVTVDVTTTVFGVIGAPGGGVEAWFSALFPASAFVLALVEVTAVAVVPVYDAVIGWCSYFLGLKDKKRVY